jgi:hypothetical protein
VNNSSDHLSNQNSNFKVSIRIENSLTLKVKRFLNNRLFTLVIKKYYSSATKSQNIQLGYG